MSDIASNIRLLKQQIPQSVKLVAVSKTRPANDILEAYNTGLKYFGENRVQELLSKKDLLPPDIEWHLIGHLQTNKVKYVVTFISMIQSVDTFRLLKTINSEAHKIGRIVDCLLQIHIAEEETKFGFNMAEIDEMVRSVEFSELKYIRICGVMGMATFTDDSLQVQKEFRYLADCFNDLKRNYFKDSEFFREISMGMSGDYMTAIREGTTMIRIGSLIFGERSKQNKPA
ncbi:MAG: YggS family pyridoxal phosphate-dependent enzyme [Bacteroidota bacterium]|nr:YggS family pyridoxal phosphate-dependent enzyme [Bacteroidota bacterium]